MTDDELLAAIEADAEAKALADSGQDEACAVRMRAVLPHVLKSQRVTDLGICAAFPNPRDGAALVVFLATASESDPLVKIAYQRLMGEGLDVGNPAVRAMIDAFAQADPGTWTPDRVAVLKALGEAPRFVTDHDVWRAYRARREAQAQSEGG